MNSKSSKSSSAKMFKYFLIFLFVLHLLIGATTGQYRLGHFLKYEFRTRYFCSLTILYEAYVKLVVFKTSSNENLTRLNAMRIKDNNEIYAASTMNTFEIEIP